MTPGRVIDERFALQDLAASGGMGSIYRARDLLTGQIVALKLVKGSASTPRFVREAGILARLEHPCVVSYVAHGIADGVPYLVMEWLEGEDLSRLLARAGRCSVAEALTLVQKTAAALGAAHRLGIVHRDVKPSNLFLVGSSIERVKVLDFGIARALQSGLTLSSSSMIGTPAYMSPEQARGDETIGTACDIFSLGCVLYECLTARPAFSGNQLMAVLTKVLLGHVLRVEQLRPEVPPRVGDLVARMLCRDPEHRPSAGALVEELSTLLRDAAIPTDTGSTSVTTFSAQELTLLCVLMIRGLPGETSSSLAVPALNADTAWQLRSAAARHHGKLEFLAGSTVVLTFESLGAATDLATHAATCALELASLLPNARMTIGTGLGFNALEMPAGEAVDRAAALLSSEPASSGTSAARTSSGVKLDEVTAGLLDGRFELTRDESGHATLASSKRRRDSSRRLLGRSTPCLGRERELSSLRALFDECVTEPLARAALLIAPGGVGKSRLCQEFVSRQSAASTRFQLWQAWADPTRSGSRLGVLKQAALGAFGILETEPAEAAQRKLSQRILSLLPGPQQPRVTEFLGELLGLRFPAGKSPQLRAARRDPRLMADQIARAWIDWLAAECEISPLVLVLDDVHWADSSSLQLLDSTLRQLSNKPLLILALGRPETHERFPDLFASRLVDRVHLAALSSPACHALARLVLPDVPETSITHIVERSAGNAFFLEELLRAEVEGHGENLPGTILAMLHARILRLSGGARHTLLAASVFGESFWPSALEPLMLPRVSEVSIDEQLAFLVDRDWVRVRRESRLVGHAEFSFRHSLIREAAYALLTPADRQLGHRAAAGWLEDAGERDAAVLAEHWQNGGEPVRASEYFQKAAGQALEAQDTSAAFAHAERAIACGASGPTLAKACSVQAEVHNWRGDFSAGYERASEALRHFAGEPLDEQLTADWAQAVHHLSWASCAMGRGDDVERLGRLLLERARTQLDESMVVALSHVASHHLSLNRIAAMKTILAWLNGSANAVTERDPSAAAALEFVNGFHAHVTSNLADTFRYFEAAATHAATAGNERMLVSVLSSLACVRETAGEYERAEAHCLEALALQARLSIQQAALTLNLGAIRLGMGRVEEALVILRDALERLTAEHNRRGQSLCHVYLARALLMSNAARAAEAEARAAGQISRDFPAYEAYAEAVLASTLLAQEQVPTAVLHAQRAMSLLEQGAVEAGEAFVRLTFAEVLKEAGHSDAARDAIRAAAERLQTTAAAIADPTLCRNFLTRVPENARTLALARAWLSVPGGTCAWRSEH
ncbi:MAG TPA: protein kinase [Polyangiaceae bacterium]|nr:protein kinase [Polyangiaceae bacterium]